MPIQLWHTGMVGTSYGHVSEWIRARKESGVPVPDPGQEPTHTPTAHCRMTELLHLHRLFSPRSGSDLRPCGGKCQETNAFEAHKAPLPQVVHLLINAVSFDDVVLCRRQCGRPMFVYENPGRNPHTTLILYEQHQAGGETIPACQWVCVLTHMLGVLVLLALIFVWFMQVWSNCCIQRITAGFCGSCMTRALYCTSHRRGL